MICFLQYSWPWRCFSPQHHLSLPGMKACLGLSHIPPNHPGTGDLEPLIQTHKGPHKTAPGVGKPNPTQFRLAMGARGRKCSHVTPTSLPKKHLGQLHWSPPHKHFSRTALSIWDLLRWRKCSLHSACWALEIHLVSTRNWLLLRLNSFKCKLPPVARGYLLDSVLTELLQRNQSERFVWFLVEISKVWVVEMRKPGEVSEGAVCLIHKPT